MKRNHFISSFFGWFLLVLFLFSITPRQLLHDVLAEHTDITAQVSTGKSAGVHKTGFNCDRLELVAESPFIADDIFVESSSFQIRCDFIAFSDQQLVPKAITLPALRGPPCI